MSMYLSELLEKIEEVLEDFGDIELGIMDEDNWEIVDIHKASVWVLDDGSHCFTFIPEDLSGEDYDPDPPKKDSWEKGEDNVVYLHRKAS